ERSRRSVDATPTVGLLRARPCLTARRHDALLHPLGEARFDTGQALRDQCEPLRDRLPLLFRLARHQVEHHSYFLHRAAEDTEIAETLAGVVLLERQLEPLTQPSRCHALG